MLAAYAERSDNKVDDYAVDLIRRELSVNQKATEDSFNLLHQIVTEELLARIQSGEASTQDLKQLLNGYIKTTSLVSQ